MTYISARRGSCLNPQTEILRRLCNIQRSPAPSSGAGPPQRSRPPAQPLWSVLGEFVATLCFLWAGLGGATAGALTPQAGGLSSSLAFGLGWAVSAYAFGPVSGAHMNPAVTLALTAGGHFRPSMCALYVAAQLCGGVCAAGLVYGHTPPAACPPAAGGGAGCAGAAPFEAALTQRMGGRPGGGPTETQAFLGEFVGSCLLCMVFLRTVVDERGRRETALLAPLVVGLSLACVHLVLGPLTGCSVNPARSLGPALLAWKWRDHWIFWAAPGGGALLAAALHRLLRQDEEGGNAGCLAGCIAPPRAPTAPVAGDDDDAFPSPVPPSGGFSRTGKTAYLYDSPQLHGSVRAPSDFSPGCPGSHFSARAGSNVSAVPPTAGFQRATVAVLRVELDYCWRQAGERPVASLRMQDVWTAHGRLAEKVAELAKVRGAELCLADGDQMSLSWGPHRSQTGSDEESAASALQAAADLHWELNVIADSLQRCTAIPARVEHYMGVAQGSCFCGHIGASANSYCVLGPAAGMAALLAAAGRERGAAVVSTAALLAHKPQGTRVRRIDILRCQEQLPDAVARASQSPAELRSSASAGGETLFQLLTMVESEISDEQLHIYDSAFEAFTQGEYERSVDLIERCQILAENCDDTDPVTDQLLLRAQRRAEQTKGQPATVRYVYHVSPPALRENFKRTMLLQWPGSPLSRQTSAPGHDGGPGGVFASCYAGSFGSRPALSPPSQTSPERSMGIASAARCLRIADSFRRRLVNAAACNEDGSSTTRDQCMDTPELTALDGVEATVLPLGADGELSEGSTPSRSETLRLLPLHLLPNAVSEAGHSAVQQEMFRSVVLAAQRTAHIAAPASIVITAVRARELIAADATTSDPYCVLDVSHRVAPPPEVRVQTRPIKNTLNPEWGEAFRFTLDRGQIGGKGVSVSVTIFDWNMVSGDEFIGFASIAVSKQQLIGCARQPLELTARLGVRPDNQADLSHFGMGAPMGDVVISVSTGSAAELELQKKQSSHGLRASAQDAHERKLSVAARKAEAKKSAEKFSTQAQLAADRAAQRTQRIMLFWNILHLLVLMYNSFFIPVRAVFMPIHRRPEEVTSTNIVELAVDTFFDVSVYYVSIYLKFTSPYEDGGAIVTDKEQIRWNYLRTWFAVDFLGCFPVELLGMLADPVAREGGPGMVWFNPWYRVGRLLNIFHLPGYLSLVFDRVIVNVNPVWARIWRFLVTMLYAVHFVTCCYYAETEADYHGGEPVLTREQGESSTNAGYLYTKMPDLPNQSLVLRYAHSMNWAVHSLTGYSVTYPITDGQTILSLCVGLAGVFVYAAVIVIISQLVEALSASEDSFRQRIDEVHDVLHHLKLPMDFRSQVIDFYKTLYANTGALTAGNDREEQLFADISSELGGRIVAWMNKRILAKVPMFARAAGDPVLMQVLLQELQPLIVTAGHRVCTRGEEGQEMYFIIRGECEVVDEDDRVVAHIPAGSFFGETALFYEVRRTATIRTRAFTQLFVLSAAALERVLLDYPEVSADVVAAAEQRKPPDTSESGLLLFARETLDTIQRECTGADA